MEEILLINMNSRISNIFIVRVAIFLLTRVVLNEIVMPTLYVKPTSGIFVSQLVQLVFHTNIKTATTSHTDHVANDIINSDTQTLFSFLGNMATMTSRVHYCCHHP
jgi:hypothetical protein